MTDLVANLKHVQARIAAAAHGAGRLPEVVTLVAVSKTRPAAEVAAAHAAGARDFGENYVQELADKATELTDLAGLRWHFIGHLQRNKVKYLGRTCTLIHSVDSLRLAEALDERAQRLEHRQPILLQVDLAGEATKNGCPIADLAGLVDGVQALPGLDWQGLMTITPLSHDPEAARPYYRQLAELAARLREQGYPAARLRHLSMGMSNDYEIAIAEGATLVRVGTALFGPRH